VNKGRVAPLHISFNRLQPEISAGIVANARCHQLVEARRRSHAALTHTLLLEEEKFRVLNAINYTCILQRARAFRWCIARLHERKQWAVVAKLTITMVPYETHILKSAPSRGGSGPPFNTWFLGPTRVFITNSISIASAVFAQLRVVYLYTLQWSATSTPKIAPFVEGSAPI